MHFFLTGDRRIGKSTVVASVLASIPARPLGFVTVFASDPGLGDKALLLHRLCDARREEAARVVARFEDGRMRADAAALDRLGVQSLAGAQTAPFVLMDECGYLERDALGFQRAVLDTLDGNRPVLGVVRLGAGGWTEAILCHPKVELRTVTLENRDALALEAIEWLKEAIR